MGMNHTLPHDTLGSDTQNLIAGSAEREEF